MQHNTAGITLSNFIGNAGGNNGVFTFAIVIDQQAGNRQTTINQLRLRELIDKIFLIRLPSVKLKPISPLAMVIRFISMSCFTGLYILSPTPLVLLLAKLFITLKLCLLFSSTAARASRA